VDPVTAFQIFEEVSRIDSAAGWHLQLAACAQPFGAWFDEGAREIFGRPEDIICRFIFSAAQGRSGRWRIPRDTSTWCPLAGR
jgi:hypothetical protein